MVFDRIHDAMCLNKKSRTPNRNIGPQHQKYSSVFHCTHLVSRHGTVEAIKLMHLIVKRKRIATQNANLNHFKWILSLWSWNWMKCHCEKHYNIELLVLRFDYLALQKQRCWTLGLRKLVMKDYLIGLHAPKASSPATWGGRGSQLYPSLFNHCQTLRLHLHLVPPCRALTYCQWLIAQD